MSSETMNTGCTHKKCIVNGTYRVLRLARSHLYNNCFTQVMFIVREVVLVEVDLPFPLHTPLRRERVFVFHYHH
jgi:hypothetical protein